MTSNNHSTDRVTVFVPNYGLCKPVFELILFYILFGTVVAIRNRVVPTVPDSIGPTLFAVVLWLFLGRAVYTLYVKQWRPNPRTFESPETARDFFADHMPTLVDWLWNSGQLLVGCGILFASWRDFTHTVALFLLAPQTGVSFFTVGFWLAAFVVGWQLMVSSIDALIVEFWRQRIGRKWVDDGLSPSLIQAKDRLSTVTAEFKEGYNEVQDDHDEK